MRRHALDLVVILVLQLVFLDAKSSSSNKSKNYLYAVDDFDNGPVVDYILDENATENVTLYPDFLYSEKSGYRIVEFYAPWCGHCRHYAPKYVKLAQSLVNSTNIQVYAVSCTVHRPLCRNQDIHGYPTVKAFPEGSVNGTDVSASSHPFDFLKALGLTHADHDNEDESPELYNDDDDDDITKESSLSLSNYWWSNNGAAKTRPYTADKQNVYRDAWVSLDYALRNNIFYLEPHGNLTNTTRRKVFRNWVSLLEKTLPYPHGMHGVVSAIYQNVQQAMDNETYLMEILEQHPPPTDSWTKDCTKGDDSQGYPCGLWELFHIVTLGVVEWNAHALESRHTLKTDQAAQVLRNYIENFFPCNECRENFLSEYDACHYNRCQRLGGNDQWRQLPLWLWETHNGVNVRLFRTKHKDNPKLWNDRFAQWPPRENCPTCWMENGTWVEDQVYKYLRIQYWPDDATSLQYRQEILPFFENQDDVTIVMPPLWMSLVPTVLCFLCWCIYNKKRQGRLKRRQRRLRLHVTDQLLTRGMLQTKRVIPR